MRPPRLCAHAFARGRHDVVTIETDSGSGRARGRIICYNFQISAAAASHLIGSERHSWARDSRGARRRCLAAFALPCSIVRLQRQSLLRPRSFVAMPYSVCNSFLPPRIFPGRRAGHLPRLPGLSQFLMPEGVAHNPSREFQFATRDCDRAFTQPLQSTGQKRPDRASNTETRQE